VARLTEPLRMAFLLAEPAPFYQARPRSATIRAAI
jgi:hypothetical protein